MDGYGYGYWDGQYANYDMTSDYANCDWGVYNAISNGGGEMGLWRTITHDEWNYLFSYRQDATYKKSKATVVGEQGWVLLPDAWIQPDGVSFMGSASDYDINNYDVNEWIIMENAGAVFLPNAGYRNNTSFGVTESYWTSKAWNTDGAWVTSTQISNASSYRYYGRPVRLIQNY